MSATWHGQAPPPKARSHGLSGWCRIALKGSALALLVFGGLLILLMVRIFEQPLYGVSRPLTPHITVFVCRNALRIIGVTLQIEGRFTPKSCAVVANHSSWLDIFVLNAVKRVYFVSKAEVAAWPGIGWLARATGTVFIERSRARAADQAQLFRERLGAGHRLLFFPEGTSSDGLRVLPFKTTLFAAFFTGALRDSVHVQPVSVIYHAPEGEDPRFYGWWGDMDFGPHLLSVLAAPRQGRVQLRYHPALEVGAFADRKALALALETAVRSGHRDAQHGSRCGQS